ncbi:hypothetical protein MLD38_006638 [Melastoma candidum]|uniref:Uncharacterized protein n=1 Tax=Melastoma candidum TaxID=119954 RepID=A0ACB9RPR6_9MYRT|nr:hypothetical protein MLD38_006638 [Melastoma candidum]
MKFGKSLSNQIEETLPEWRDKFLSYKDLKKRLKLIEPKVAGDGERSLKRKRPEGCGGEVGDPAVGKGGGMTNEEMEFIRLLVEEMDKFNTFFVEQEEEYIIRLKELQDRLAMAKDSTEIINIRKEIVDFHGEMVLLENYSALNYTGLVKILKKYDKRTGALIRMPFIQKVVLQQPFFITDVLGKLIKECEKMLDHLFPTKDILASSSEAGEATLADETSASAAGNAVGVTPGEINEGGIRIPKELAEIEQMKNMYMKSTLSALRVLKEIRSGSSTVSHFSLPPLKSSGAEESWNKKVPVLEQEAK